MNTLEFVALRRQQAEQCVAIAERHTAESKVLPTEQKGPLLLSAIDQLQAAYQLFAEAVTYDTVDRLRHAGGL